MMSNIKSWIVPALAALALGVVSCTQPNQTAHSSSESRYPIYAATTNGNMVYRIIDCDTKSIVYTSDSGGLSAVPMRDSSVVRAFCGGE